MLEPLSRTFDSVEINVNYPLLICTFLIVSLFTAVSSSAQLSVEYISESDFSTVDFQSEFKSKEDFQDYLIKRNEEYEEEGYLSFSVDSIVDTNEVLRVYLYVGEKFSADTDRLEQRRLSNELERLEDSGYPFARVVIDNSLDSLSVERRVRFEPGPYITFDSLILLQEPDLPAKVLGYHLSVRSGEAYSEKVVKTADKRLKQLPFVKVVRPTSVLFTDKKSRVLLAIEKRSANQVDGIIGFQPDETGKVSFTGELKLDLHNSFSHLDNLFLQWQRVADNTQKLEFKIRYPYLFGTSLGVRGGIQQFRQDTTFNQIELGMGLFSVLDNGSELSIFFESNSVVDLLSEEFSTGRSTSTIQYGSTYEFRDLDDLFNPQKGTLVNARVSYGDKELRDRFSSENPSKVDQWVVSMLFERYIAIGNRSTILLRGRGMHMESDVIIFNELQRIGGLHTLRGSDEQSIRASSYGVLTSEFRLITDERSYLTAFVDYGWYQRSIEAEYLRDNPFGLGVGAAFSTKAGILNINYALGSQFGQPLSFTTGKVHFGYSALF